MQYNARISLVDLSKKTGVSVFQLKNRISQLIKKDILNGFIPYVSLVRFGLQFYFVFLNVKKERELAFETWVKEYTSIIWCTKYMGQYNYKLSIFACDNAFLLVMLEDLYKEFNDAVSHIECLPVFRNPLYTSFITSRN